MSNFILTILLVDLLQSIRMYFLRQCHYRSNAFTHQTTNHGTK